MISVIYNKAFAVELSHDFFETSNKFDVNKSLEIFPSVECERILKKGKMRVFRKGSGLLLFYQAFLNASNSQQVLVPLSNGTEFSFPIRLKSDMAQFFLNVSNLNVNSKTFKSGNFFMLSANITNSSTNPVTMSADLADLLRPAIFTSTFTPAGNYALGADIAISDTSGEVYNLNGVPYNTDTNTYSAEIDLGSLSKGYYTLKAYKQGMSHIVGNELYSTTLYMDTDLSKENVFGIIKIKFTDISKLYISLNDLNPPLTIQYTFANRNVKWRYYTAIGNVPANFFTNRALEIIDNNTPTPIYTFTGLNSGKPYSGLKINGRDTVIITSDSAIPFKETAIPRFYLRQMTDNNPNPPTYKTLLTSLQNATQDGVDSNRVGVINQEFAEIFLFLDSVTP